MVATAYLGLVYPQTNLLCEQTGAKAYPCLSHIHSGSYNCHWVLEPGRLGTRQPGLAHMHANGYYSFTQPYLTITSALALTIRSCIPAGVHRIFLAGQFPALGLVCDGECFERA